LSQEEPRARAAPTGRRLAALSLAALGVVYGDIGTSPLYALRECFFGTHAIPVNHENVLGILSLIVWALVLVVSVKYLGFILRADNRGEGGILALMALVHPEHGGGQLKPRVQLVLVALGLFGAALLYGDGMITPAISVLSAIEGLEVATPLFSSLVVPITIAVLVLLFMLQSRGTARVGAIFGPITLVWFTVLGVLGAGSILGAPQVLTAIDPLYAVRFFVNNGRQGFLVLGAVFLVVTGGEALYADMGHFGARPIRLAWFALVLPALLLNYFGQGALLLRRPATAHNPFYRLAPDWALYPLVVLATVATVIASQAVISGAFSLTRQAIQLGYLPRMTIRHTSAEEIGQIYLPMVNRILAIATIGLVIGFRSSSRLAAAYGIAVTTTMVITTVIFYVVASALWGWSRWAIGALTLLFLAVDLSFFSASVVKIEYGGWFPIVVAISVYVVLVTWRKGRQLLAARLGQSTVSAAALMTDGEFGKVPRVKGTAIFLAGNPDAVPVPLLHNLKHNRVLHERVVFLTVLTEEVPRVPRAQKVTVENLGSGFFRIVARYGFIEVPRIEEILELARQLGLDIKFREASYFLGRERLLASKLPGMAIWREKLFAFLSSNSLSATTFYGLPPNRVVELGAQIEI
jgi:KUP system potassium uptake protein